MPLRRTLVVAALGAALGLHEHGDDVPLPDGTCVPPGICTPPSTKYSRVMTGPKPGQQWNINGGFCGAFSIQQASLAKGAWLSQDKVRKANRNGGAEPHGEHGDTTSGFEVLPINVGYTAKMLRLTYDEFNYSLPKPQAQAFKQFLKKNLVHGNALVWFPMCKGDSHLPYGPPSCPNGGHLDHVEPIFGIFSDHPLNDTTVFDDDWVLHASDQDLMPYYRKMSTLQDTTSMDGNCKNAGAGFGKNEMYPCFDDQVTYGLAVTGLDIEGAITVALSVPLTSEPNVRYFQPSVDIKGTIKAAGLQPNKDYVLLRYRDTDSLPMGPPFTGYAAKTPFVALADGAWSFEDPVTFRSDSATYYFVAESAAVGSESIVV